MGEKHMKSNSAWHIVGVFPLPCNLLPSKITPSSLTPKPQSMPSGDKQILLSNISLETLSVLVKHHSVAINRNQTQGNLSKKGV